MSRTHFDYWLLFVTVLLVGVGVVMVYSSSAVLAAERYNDSYYFLKKELLFVGLGLGVAVAISRVPYGLWRNFVYPLLGLSIILILLSYVPGFRNVTGGAARWIIVGPLHFQPSELAKVAFIIFMAYSMEKKVGRMGNFGVGVLPHLIVGGIIMLLILGQRDLGSTFTIGCMLALMLFAGGMRKIYLAAFALLTIPLVYFAVAGMPYRRQRILAFLDPWSDRYGSGFQIIQSLLSFNQGGFFGQGLGEGQQKLFYLPEAHTDFIAAVLAEELGLIGIFAVLILFAFFTKRGFMVARKAPDFFGRYLALGITLLVTCQALANLCVVMGLLPTKGMVLPFISYGGSSLVVTLLAVGILLNISMYSKTPLITGESGARQQRVCCGAVR